MLFKRRNPRSSIRALRELLWPTMGWGRALSYVGHRVIRLSDTPQNIAAGLAIGASMSFTPLVGTHFIQSGIVAYLTRVNIAASLIGTFAGNPWTFPFMWWGAIILGTTLFDAMGLDQFTMPLQDLTLPMLWDTLQLFFTVTYLLFAKFVDQLLDFMGLLPHISMPVEQDINLIWGDFTHSFVRIFMPWLLGGYLIALLSWPIFYLIFYHLVRGAKAARSKAHLRKMHKVAKQVTGQKI